MRARGARALRGVGLVVALAVATAGLLLALVPGMDHHWLDALEAAMPAVRSAFLTPFERQTWADAEAAIARATADLDRLRAVQKDVQWGARPMDEPMQERLRQFLASRTEIAAGDRMVLRTLRARARERQRYRLGVPLLAAGVAGAGGLAWTARRRPGVMR